MKCTRCGGQMYRDWDDIACLHCGARVSEGESVELAFRKPEAQPVRKLQEFCIHGHEMTPENTYMPPNGKFRRECRTCKRENDLRRRKPQALTTAQRAFNQEAVSRERHQFVEGRR